MARQIFVLALVLIALVRLVSADNAKATPGTSPSSQGGSEAAAAAAANDDTIGNTDEDAGAPSNSTDGDDANVAVECPIGSEGAANSAAGAAQPPSSGASTLGVSAVAGAAAVAGYFVF